MRAFLDILIQPVNADRAVMYLQALMKDMAGLTHQSSSQGGWTDGSVDKVFAVKT